MSTITTKLLSATATQGSRIKATCGIFNKIESYSHAISASANHRLTAIALAEALGMSGNWVGCETTDGICSCKRKRILVSNFK